MTTDAKVPLRVRIKQAASLVISGATLADPSEWRRGRLVSSSSGRLVTVDGALTLSTFWGCVRLISETFGTLPGMLYRTLPDGTRELATNEPLFDLIHSSPNADYSAVEFWEGMCLSLCLQGNAYAEKSFIGKRLVALKPLAAAQMIVRRDDRGAREYRYTDKGRLRIYTENEIFHVRGFGVAGDVGLSPVAFARHSIGAAMSAEDHAGKMLSDGLRQRAGLQIPKILTHDQRKAMKEGVVDLLNGDSSVVLLEGGSEWKPISISPDDAQFLQTRAFQVEEICRWFRVPPFMVGHTQKSTSWGTGLEQQLIGFLNFSLRPYLVRFEQAISRSLMTPEQRQTLKAEFKVEGLLRTDSAARAAFYAVMVTNGIMTRNEVRRLENMPPLDGGDELTVQAQNVPLADAPKLGAPREPDDETEVED